MSSTLACAGAAAALAASACFACPALVWWLLARTLLFMVTSIVLVLPLIALGVRVVSAKSPPRPLIAPTHALGNTVRYWAAILNDEVSSFGSPSVKQDDEQQLELRRARMQVWQVRLVFKLWDEKHYRCSSFAQDLRENLGNLAFPGTAMPLSLWCSNKWAAWLFALIVYPVACFCSAFAVLLCDQVVKSPLSNMALFLSELSLAYQRQLLNPEDWFSLWRLNCAVTALHDNTLKEKVKSDYDMESKWDFLVRAEQKNVPASPCVGLGKLAMLGQTLGAEIVAKDKNCEGGMGIHFLKNACCGGDWILQPRLSNSKSLDALLPKKAPLSTMRVLTASCAGMPEGSEWRRGRDEITPLTVVFRAGRAGAQTDHSAIFYNVDMDSGKITRGGSNAHWYEVGLGKVTSQRKSGAWTKTGVFRGEGFKKRREAQGTHPDTGVDLVGKQMPQIQASLELCKRAHKELCASVPLAGWDVVLVDEEDGSGQAARVVPLLLEVNLSCNFFLGSFDEPWYFQFCEDWVHFLEAR